MSDKQEIKPVAKKSRLGRGLGSLLGGASDLQEKTKMEAEVISPIQGRKAEISLEDSAEMGIEHHRLNADISHQESRVWQIDIEKIQPNRKQPRKFFEKAALKELADSIKVQGILIPIVARKKAEGGFEIIAGERRWRAAQIAGLEKVPVLLKQVEAKTSLELALIENIQRENLNPVEEAEAYKQLVEKYGMTQQEVADQVGKERTTVTNSLRLLTLPLEVLQMVSERKLTLGHAKALLGLGDPQKQKMLAGQMFDEKISVRQAEKLVRKIQTSKDEGSKSASKEAQLKNRLIQDLETDLQKALGTKVAIDYNNSKGRITLSFYSDEELNGLVDRLKNNRG